MQMNMKDFLTGCLVDLHLDESALQLPDVQIDTEQIKCVMINEVPPLNPEDGFYSRTKEPNYMKTTLALFHDAGVQVKNMDDILSQGIYITTAVKAPKHQYTVPGDMISSHLPLLEKEIGLFPNLKVIMLMGDVAKKAFNQIAKKKTGKNVIPSASTCRIRAESFYYGQIRVFPSYIMTGGYILIEKGKCTMTSDDIRRMMEILQQH